MFWMTPKARTLGTHILAHHGKEMQTEKIIRNLL